ncbi:MAG: hypothetical protein HC933_13945 [Pleurocapsa sp. SU_196_0]|nr:hypothetical protein [Pleurocapsa sp. SU_196_0]
MWRTSTQARVSGIRTRRCEALGCHRALPRRLYSWEARHDVRQARESLEPHHAALADPDEKQWIQRGPSIDLSAFPTGVTQLGGYKFDVSGAVMLKGARAGAQDLPDTATLEINSLASSIAFLHTSGWLSPLTSPRTRIGAYKINYSDGTFTTQPLEYGRQITAWTDILPKTLTYEPVWRGKTKETWTWASTCSCGRTRTPPRRSPASKSRAWVCRATRRCSG